MVSRQDFGGKVPSEGKSRKNRMDLKEAKPESNTTRRPKDPSGRSAAKLKGQMTYQGWNHKQVNNK
jgi:hypothetical protein